MVSLPPVIIDQHDPLPFTLNLVLYQYADYQQSFIWQKDGLPVDLTGFTATWVAESLTGILFNWSSGVTLSGAATPGLLTLLIPGAQTALLATSDPPCVHDLLLTAPDSSMTRLIEGTVGVYPGVSSNTP